jgi:hypothetical protein
MSTAKTESQLRPDVVALWGGILFGLLFTALIWWARPIMEDVTLLPDQGVAWYYWKLPEPTFWTHATAWGFYLMHQFAIWGLIWSAQRQKNKYIPGLHRFNIAALGVNIIFTVIHFLQTAIWYDGLAQDVSIFSSQGSVIVMLVWILLMETPRRGLFFGKRVSFSQAILGFAKKYHGYVFSWAIIYTFWYHPMVSTPGHLLGFVYTFFLLLQGSLFFTRMHLNKWWKLVQEVSVLIHGAIVAAITQNSDIWPMFAFGFGGLLVITQMHGLGLSAVWKWIITGLYVAATVWVYSGRGLAALNEIIRIPVIEYAAVFLLAGLIWLGLWIAGRVRGRGSAGAAATGD